MTIERVQIWQKNTLPLCQIYFQTIYRHLFPFCGQKDGKLMPAKLFSQKGVRINGVVIFFSQVWKGFSIAKKKLDAINDKRNELSLINYAKHSNSRSSWSSWRFIVTLMTTTRLLKCLIAVVLSRWHLNKNKLAKEMKVDRNWSCSAEMRWVFSEFGTQTRHSHSFIYSCWQLLLLLFGISSWQIHLWAYKMA